MKKITSLLLAIVLIMSALCVGTSAVENEVKVTLDGFEVLFDVPGRLIGDRTMVPVRAIFEALGAEINWVAETQEIICTRGEDTVKLTVGSTELYKNGELAYTMDVAPVIIEENGASRTLVPARAVSEAFGCTVDWVAETRTAVVTNINDSTVMLIGGFPVDLDTYTYYVKTALENENIDLAVLESDPAAVAAFAELVISNIVSDYSAVDIAADLGHTIYDANAKAAVDSAVEEYKGYYGDAFETILAESYMTEEIFKNFLYYTLFESTVVEELQMSYADVPAEDKITLLTESEFVVRAAHILLEDIETAEAILEKAKAASDEEFFALVSEYGTDPGMIDNTDGYYFTPGQMISEFEDAVFALAENETSDIIESEFGYHIIRRLPKDAEYVSANADVLFDSIVLSDYYATIEANALALSEEVVLLEKYDEIDLLEDMVKPFYSAQIPAEEIIGIPEVDIEDIDEETADETITDEIAEDEIIEDEVVEDEVIEDETVEDKVVEDEAKESKSSANKEKMVKIM